MRRNDLIQHIASEIILKSIKKGEMTKIPNFDVAQDYAEVALKIIEKTGRFKPRHSEVVKRLDIECVPYEETIYYEGYEHD